MKCQRRMLSTCGVEVGCRRVCTGGCGGEHPPPDDTRPLRFGIPLWIEVVLWAPRLVAVLGFGLLLRRRSRHAAGTAITLGAAALVALEQYWKTPPPGLPPG